MSSFVERLFNTPGSTVINILDACSTESMSEGGSREQKLISDGSLEFQGRTKAVRAVG